MGTTDKKGGTRNDEISMVDLGLFGMLVGALPKSTQLVLAGDLRQLPAVDGVALDQALQFIAAQKLVVDVRLVQTFRFSPEKAAIYARLADQGMAALQEDADGLKRVQFTKPAQLAKYLTEYAKETYLGKEAADLRQALLATPLASLAESPVARRAFTCPRPLQTLPDLRGRILRDVPIDCNLSLQ
jgi:exodeoxyribonuclease V alpha subunit